MTDEIKQIECPTCERPFAPGDEIPKAVADAIAAEHILEFDDGDDEPTDLEILQDYISKLEAEYAVTKNIWTADRISQLKEEAAKWYDSEGNRLEVVPDVQIIRHQISPLEAQTLDGWWTVYPKEYGVLDKWTTKQLSDFDVDLSEGLDLSRNRSNGCFVVRNKQETADVFLNDTDRVAHETGTSRRIIKMMGYALDGYRYMFPTHSIKSVSPKFSEGVGNYAFEPEVPFTALEKEVWVNMFSRYHFSGPTLLGVKWSSYPVQLHAERPQGEDRENVDSNGKHRCLVVANHPHFILPRMILEWNSAKFKYSLWRNMCNKAHAIDRNAASPIPGYESLAEMGKTPRDYEELGENTAGNSQTRPIFHKGSELNRDGSKKTR